MEDLLRRCSMAAGCEISMTEAVVQSFLAGIAEELSKGNSVDLGENFGTFIVKLRDGKPQEGSPRTPKEARYKVVFRENRGLKKKLKQTCAASLQAEDPLEKTTPQ